MKDKSIQELINLYHSGKLTIVEKKVIELIKKNPKSFVLYNLFGAVLSNQKNFDKAVINYKKSIEINPDYAEGHNNLGSALYKLGKFNESIDSYQQAIKINPEYAEAYNNLGNVYDINEKVDEAILNYKKAIKINANFVEAYSNLGNLLKEIGKVDEARNCENKLLSLKPNDIGYRINITLSIIPVVSSVEEINFHRNEYQKGLELLKKYQYLTEKPGDTITTNFFHLGKKNDWKNLLNPGKVYPILRKCAEEGRVHVHRGEEKFPDIPRF